MDPQQVDVVRLHAAKAVFDRAHHVLAVVAGRVRIGVVHRERVLGGDDHAVAFAFEPSADDLLGLAPVIFVGRVEEVASRLGVGVEHRVARGLVGTEAPLLPEAHRAQAEFRNAKARGAEKSVAQHGLRVARGHTAGNPGDRAVGCSAAAASGLQPGKDFAANGSQRLWVELVARDEELRIAAARRGFVLLG